VPLAGISAKLFGLADHHQPRLLCEPLLDRDRATCEQCNRLLSVDGLADQEPLHFCATMFLEKSQLLLRFDALARRPHSEPIAHGYDGPHDNVALIAFLEFGDKRSVELNFVEWKFE